MKNQEVLDVAFEKTRTILNTEIVRSMYQKHVLHSE